MAVVSIPSYGRIAFVRSTTTSTTKVIGRASSLFVMSRTHSSGASAGNSHADSGEKMAKLIPSTPSSLANAGARLRGDFRTSSKPSTLVSFPTETVYGLGANALSSDDCASIFAAKRRPLDDPLIVHVADASDAYALWAADDISLDALRVLAARFWPGPLTLVAPAAPCVPSIVTAGTGHVALRSPSHPVARALIRAAGVPLAAPSANRFGHVSPTRASHVLDDLGGEDVWVVDADDACGVGVESTVARVDGQTRIVTVLRHGAVAKREMQEALEEMTSAGGFVVESACRSAGGAVQGPVAVSPGQAVRHYAPDVTCYVVSRCAAAALMSSVEKSAPEILSRAVVIDYGGRLSALQPHCLAYRDLSENCQPKEAASCIFDTLRWSEEVEGADRVYLPEIILEEEENGRDDGGLLWAVRDRLTRAASGITISELQ